MRSDHLRSMVRFLTVVCLLLSLPYVLTGKSVLKLSLRDLNGNKVRLSDYQGQILVLNFWATWCGPCKEELPRLGHIAQAYADRHVTFVLASIDEPKKMSVVRDFLSRQKVTLPVLVGASTDMLSDLSGTYVVPATLIIDENGEIVRAINGEAREEDIKEALDWLLKGRTGPRPANRLKRY